jgi:uncharacterized membrane protein YeaQ/YmgE (transglycosylase-associated protein family)
VLIFLIILALLIAGGIWLTVSFLGLLVTLAIALVVGLVADRIVPGEIPGGWLGAMVAGLAGSWLGTSIMGQVGPTIAGIALLPALIGAIILAFAVELIGRAVSGASGRGHGHRPTTA